MAATLTTKITGSLTATYKNDLDLASRDIVHVMSLGLTLASGTGSGQANMAWSDTRTLAASTTEDLDLAGALTDGTGATLTFARVKVIAVKAATANTNNVLVGGAAATQFVGWVSDATDKVVVRPGGLLLLYAPDATAYPLTGGASDFLRIGNSGAGTGVDYSIVLIGSSA